MSHNLEWSIAGLQCRSVHKDAHLLVVNDADEQSAVAGMLASTSRLCTFRIFCHSLPLAGLVNCKMLPGGSVVYW